MDGAFYWRIICWTVGLKFEKYGAVSSLLIYDIEDR